jgi:hypothetical protein
MAVNVFRKELFRNQVNQALIKDKSLIDIAFAEAEEDFIVQKDELIEEFENHPVTLELEEGPDSDGGMLDYGNLYSFIGFTKGKNPIEPLRELLQNNISIRKTSLGAKYGKNIIRFEFPINGVTDAEIHHVTPMPERWSSGSWAQKIERSIIGFTNYLFDRKGFKKSASGTGLEIENGTHGSFNSIPYILSLLKNFRNKFI